MISDVIMNEPKGVPLDYINDMIKRQVYDYLLRHTIAVQFKNQGSKVEVYLLKRVGAALYTFVPVSGSFDYCCTPCSAGDIVDIYMREVSRAWVLDDMMDIPKLLDDVYHEAV